MKAAVLAIVFGPLLLPSVSVYSDSATWAQRPSSVIWYEPSNWVPATVPNGPDDVATFRRSDQQSLIITPCFADLSGIRFESDAGPYTITVFEPKEAFHTCNIALKGDGVINLSGVTQHFVSDSTFWGAGGFAFANDATAGSMILFTNKGAAHPFFDSFPSPGVAFYHRASAGRATFINKGGATGGFPGIVDFYDDATAAESVITNEGAPIRAFNVGENGGNTRFFHNASAGNASLTNHGGLANGAPGGFIRFADDSTANHAFLTNYPGAVSGASGATIEFNQDSSAAQSTITNKAGSLPDRYPAITQFNDHSSAGESTITNEGATGKDAYGGGTSFYGGDAGNAILIATGGTSGGQGGQLFFQGDSTGGTARVVLQGNGSLDVHWHPTPGITIGSIEGDGNVILGSNTLTVGTRNTDTTFDGVIQDGALTKIGTGTLRLGGTNTYPGPTTINAGKLDVNGAISGPVIVNNGGTLSGSGAIRDLRINDGGLVNLRDNQPLLVQGQLLQNPGGVLRFDVAEADPFGSGQLDVSGDAILGGTLEVRFLNGFLPVSGQVFRLFHVHGSVVGSFATVIFPDLRNGFQFQADIVDEYYQLVALSDGVPATGFLNLSTRIEVGTGDNAAIGGFIVTGTTPKRVLLRAIGPSLMVNGVPLPGRLVDPTLELRDSAGAMLLANDNWSEGAQAQEILETGIPPVDQNESAILVTLAPGAYTAIMLGTNHTTGIGVVELYDLTPNPASRLANISTRGVIGTGDRVMIGGFIADNQAMHALVRALGPSLAQFGVANALTDPVLELRDAQGALIGMNDDWQQSQQFAIAGTGLTPPDEREPAILTTLPAGSYTAIVRGKNDTTGVGLVEVYGF